MSKYCAVQLRVPVRVTVLSNSTEWAAPGADERSARYRGPRAANLEHLSNSVKPHDLEILFSQNMSLSPKRVADSEKVTDRRTPEQLTIYRRWIRPLDYLVSS